MSINYKESQIGCPKIFKKWFIIQEMGMCLIYRSEGLGIFLFTTVSRTALGPTQPPVQWVPEVLSMGGKVART